MRISIGMRLFVFVVSFLVLSTFSVVAESNEKAIKGIYANYRSAVAEKNGELAAKMVRGNIFEYFERIRRGALYGTRSELLQLSFTDAVTMLRFRKELNRIKLERSTGMDLYVYSINSGWVESDTISKTDVGKVEVKNNVAMVEQIYQGNKTGGRFIFEMIGDRWRLDALAIMASADFAFERELVEKKIGKEELLNDSLRTLYGEGYEVIWQPLAPVPEELKKLMKAQRENMQRDSAQKDSIKKDNANSDAGKMSSVSMGGENRDSVQKDKGQLEKVESKVEEVSYEEKKRRIDEERRKKAEPYKVGK